MISLTWDAKTLVSKLASIESKLPAAIMMALNTKAVECETYAKQNAPWTDRTGQARRTLKGKAEQMSSTTFRVSVSHGVWYGQYLEYAHEKNWAIVHPTIQAKQDSIAKCFEGILNKVSV